MNKMRPLKKLISYDDAKRIIMENVTLIESTESVPLVHARARVSADDIVAKMDVPPFDRAAMDGYAVIAEDTFGAGAMNPRELRVIGEIFAGEKSKITIEKGTAAKIATGAKLPKGADSVVMVEDTEAEGNIVRISKPAYPGLNVSKKGCDMKAGDVVVAKNTELDAGKIGAIASLGYTDVVAYNKPRVAIIPTGNEIAEVGTHLEEGQVYNSNTYSVAAVVEGNGGRAIAKPIAEDTKDALGRAVAGALNEADVVVITGGSSVGERDVIVDVLSSMGNVLFHGVQVKPGKPMIFAIANKKPIFGLPGYPTSCLMNAFAFVLPALRKCARLKEHHPKTITARLGRRIVSTLGRHQFFTVKLEGDVVMPAFKESGAITSMANADGYIEIPANVDLVEKDEVVEVKLF